MAKIGKVKGVSNVSIGEIVGGTQPLARDIGDAITIQHIWDTYRWYPGFKAIIELGTDVVWSNGLKDGDESNPLLPDRLLECKATDRYNDTYGYAIAIVDGARNPPTVEGWHPEIDGIGFTYTAFSPYGDPLEIRIKMKVAETSHELHWLMIPAYPCELDNRGERILTQPIPGKFGFFSIRTEEGLKGVQGLPKYLDLIDPIRGQYDILKSYIPYAEKQGLAHPVVGLKDNSPTNRAQVKSDFNKQPQKDRLVIISMEDALEYASPQQNAWDPWPILDWVNNMIARATQMNKLMLEGDPAGYLSASETSISNWEAKVKETQVYKRTQFLPIWIALGCTDECSFSDPAKPSFISLMEGIKMIREGMDGIVAKEDIVRLMNERLMLEGADELEVISDEELEKSQNIGGDEDGPGGNSEGDKSDKTETD